MNDQIGTRIAIALERLADAMAPPVRALPPMSSEAADCEHPEDDRIDFGTTNGVADWQCRLCGYRTVTETTDAA